MVDIGGSRTFRGAQDKTALLAALVAEIENAGGTAQALELDVTGISLPVSGGVPFGI